MNFKRCILTGCALLLLACNGLFAHVLLPPSGNFRQILSLNKTWKFKYLPGLQTGTDSLFFNPGFNVSNWVGIMTLENWQLQGSADLVYGAKLKDCTSLYRTNFTVLAGWKRNPICIPFWWNSPGTSSG